MGHLLFYCAQVNIGERSACSSNSLWPALLQIGLVFNVAILPEPDAAAGLQWDACVDGVCSCRLPTPNDHTLLRGVAGFVLQDVKWAVPRRIWALEPLECLCRHTHQQPQGRHVP